MSDPEYLEHVSTAMMETLAEAHELAARGVAGAELTQLLLHARDLHDVLVEELAEDDISVREFAGGALAEMGERLHSLERFINAH